MLDKLWDKSLKKHLSFTENSLLECEIHSVLLSRFLDLNPRGEVPAIKFEEKIVTDSTRIIHLLESK